MLSGELSENEGRTLGECLWGLVGEHQEARGGGWLSIFDGDR